MDGVFPEGTWMGFKGRFWGWDEAIEHGQKGHER